MKPTNTQRELEALIEQAMKQPGVADAMRLYEPLKQATDAVEQVQLATSPKWIASCSNSSVK